MRPTPLRTSVLLLVVALLTAGAAVAQVKITEIVDLRGVYPLGGRQGARVVVQLLGRNLDEAAQVLVSCGGIRVLRVAPKNAAEAEAELELAPDAAPGPRLVRVVGKFGVSDPVPFVVGRIPETLEREPNSEGSAAGPRGQPVSLPTVLNGQLNPPEDVDCFRFHARADETTVLAVESYTLEASPAYGEGKGRRWVDATLTIYDGSGRVVARNEDYHTPDPLIAFRPERDGEYVAEIRDLGYQGAPAAGYRLTVGTLPWVTSIYPAGARADGSPVEVELRGFNLNGPKGESQRSRLELPQGADSLRWVAPLAGMGSARPFLAGSLPETLEAEPNDGPGRANPALLSTVVNGCIERERDADSFRLSLAKGQAIHAVVVANGTLRSPVDLVLSVADASGKLLAENDDTGRQFAPEDTDPFLAFTAPADGEYVFTVRDVAGRGNRDGVYRLTFAPAAPRLELTTFWDNVAIRGRGGSGAFLALVDRRGFAGPVRVRVAGLPPGFTGSEATILPRHDSALLTVTAHPETPLGSVARFHLEGEAVVDGQTLPLRNRLSAQRDQDGETLWVPSDGCVAVVVPATEFQLHTAVRELEGAPGETVRIPVRIDRASGYDAPFALNTVQCKFNLGGTPELFRAVVSVPASARSVEIPLSLPANLPPGEYTFAVCRGMGHDFRMDRPYPSTPLLRLRVQERRAR